MKEAEILGYQVKVIVRKAGDIYTAKCPGIGGVYEQAKTREEVLKLAKESVEATIEARIVTRSLITEDNPYLKVLRQPTHNIEFIETPEKSTLCFLIPSNVVEVKE